MGASALHGFIFGWNALSTMRRACKQSAAHVGWVARPEHDAKGVQTVGGPHALRRVARPEHDAKGVQTVGGPRRMGRANSRRPARPSKAQGVPPNPKCQAVTRRWLGRTLCL